MKQFQNRIKYLAGMFAMVLLLGGSTVLAGQQGNVYDDANLLSETELTSLSDTVDALAAETGWSVYAVTTEEAGGKTSQAYADDFFDAYAPGADGVVLLIDMDNREITISTGGIAIRYLTDERIEAVLDEGYAYISEGEYYECLQAMADTVSYYYGKGIPENQYNYDTETGEISRYHSLTLFEFLVALVAGVATAAIVYGVIVGKYRLKFGTYQYDFRQFGKLELEREEDQFVNQNVIHHHIQRDTSSSGGHSSGRSSTHTSSGGHSHGGGSRKF